VVPQRRQALEQLVLHATTLRIPIVEVEGGSLTSLACFDGHQGVALVVGPRVFATLDDVLARGIERGEPAFVLVLDSLEDPQNVGTLLRSAEAAGVDGVVFPTARQAPLSPAAVKAAAGATEHLRLAPVDDLPGALADLHVRGIRVVGTEMDAPLTARESDLRGPIALVVGSEGHGLSPAVRRRCDLFVRIPMRGAIESLNAAVAGSILLFEVLGQRGEPPAPAAATPAKATSTAPSTAPKRTAAAPAAATPAKASGKAPKRTAQARSRPASDTADLAVTEAGTADPAVLEASVAEMAPRVDRSPSLEAPSLEAPAPEPEAPAPEPKPKSKPAKARLSQAKKSTAAPVEPEPGSDGDDLLPGA